jgi:arabinose-5-phosphate isomerase
LFLKPNFPPPGDDKTGLSLASGPLSMLSNPHCLNPPGIHPVTRNMAKSHNSPRDQPSPSHTSIDSALRTLQTQAGGIDALAAAFRDSLGRPFVAAVDLIRGAKGRVIVSGMGKSGHVARKIAATFASTGTPAFFVHPGEASHGDLGMIASDDVIVALSWSGETSELRNLIDYSKRFRIGLIAITAEAASTLGKAADIALVLPQVREACPHNLAPTTSSLVQLALGDALAIALLESRGFTAVDFGVLHPGGKLGALLKFVRDVMHSGAAMPLIANGAKMSDALLEMSGKGFGCLGVTGKDGRLVGIITDGDLRRHMSSKLLEATVDAVMTRNPKTAKPDQLASEIIELLNSMKITALFVVEADRPVGIVHIHDLLRAGAA